jgi:hypothetical protein
MDWPCLLAYITGTVDQELLFRNVLSSLKTGFLKPRSRVGCFFPTLKGPRWPKSVIGSHFNIAPRLSGDSELIHLVVLVRAVVGGDNLCMFSPLAPVGEWGSGVRGAD